MNAPADLDDLGSPAAVGRTAEVYRLPNDTVLKLFHADIPEAEIAAEETNSAEAVRLGATAVACRGRLVIGGRTGLVFDEIVGRSLTQVAEQNVLLVRAVGRTLGRLHAELHAKSTDGLPDIRDVALRQLDAEPLAFLLTGERAAAARLIAALPDRSAVLHMDFHPQNVFQLGDRHEVIDWATALRGAPAADVASTQFLLHDAELWPGTPALKRLLYNAVRRTLLAAYLAEYLKLSAMDRGEIARWRLPIVILRLGMWDIDSERPRLQREIRDLVAAEAGR